MKREYAHKGNNIYGIFLSFVFIIAFLLSLIVIKDNTFIIVTGICLLISLPSLVFVFYDSSIKVYINENGMKFYYSKKRIVNLRWEDVADCGFYPGRWAYYHFRSNENIEFTINYSKKVKRLMDKYAPSYIKEGLEKPLYFKFPNR